MEAHTQIQQLFPLFNGDDYELWSIKMKTLLVSHDLWDVIETKNPNQDIEEQVLMIQKELRIKDMKALIYMLQMSVSDSIFHRIARATSSKQAWELLKADFEETEKIKSMKRGFLWMMFENLTMKEEEEESISEFIRRVMEIVNKLRFYGRNILEQEVISKIIQKLPPKFHQSVSLIRSSGDLTITEVVEILRAEEWSISFRSFQGSNTV